MISHEFISSLSLFKFTNRGRLDVRGKTKLCFCVQWDKTPCDYNSSQYIFILYQWKMSDSWCWIEISLRAGVCFVLTSHLTWLHLKALWLIHSCLCIACWLPCTICLCAASCKVFMSYCIESGGPVLYSQPGQSAKGRSMSAVLLNQINRKVASGKTSDIEKKTFDPEENSQNN